MSGIDRVYLVDDNGHNLGLRATRNALDVYMQDQTTPIVDLYLHKHLLTVNGSDAAIDDRVIYSSDASSVQAGQTVCFKENGRFFQGQVLSQTDSTFNLDTPLDYAYSAGGYCSVSEHDMAVDGSATTQVYHLQPSSGQQWDITRLMFYVEDSATMDDGLFGGGAALVNGIVIRKRDTVYYNLFNIKTNGEFAQRAYDRSYTTKPPAGTGHSMIVRRTFAGASKNGVAIRLNGTSGDQLEALIQDSHTAALDHLHIIAQGHIVE